MSQTISQPPPPSLEGEPSDGAPASGDALSALLHRVAIAPIPDRGWLRAAGEDRVRWLNGMVTNAIAALAEGEGSYNFFLNAQGQIQGDADIFRRADDLLLQTARDAAPRLLEMLDHFIIMDDVELTDLSAARSGILVAGPDAATLLQSSLGLSATEIPLSLHAETWRDLPLTVVHAHSPLVPRYELWGTPDTIAALAAELASQQLTTADPPTLECLRILEGTPRIGVDIRGRELPQETAQTRALHFNKGCYLGQEIVERIRSRGKVNRTFSGLLLDAARATPGDEIFAGEQSVGVVTSVANLPSASLLFPPGVRPALGYVRRDALETGRELTCSNGRATVASLPFNLPGPPVR